MQMKLKELFKLIDEKKLTMPDFQRDFVWSQEQQKELIASLLLNLPVGSFLLLSGNKDDFATKEIGFPKREDFPKEDCKYLLDGQQRMTTLKYILSDAFVGEDWETVIREIYPRLKNRWFLRIFPNGEEDVFGWRNLFFDANTFRKEEATYIEERLLCESIGVTLKSKWCNPDYVLRDKEGKIIEDINSAKAMSIKANIIAEKGLVPLYTLYNSTMEQRPLFEMVIDRIADARVKDLIAECYNDPKRTIRLLSKIDGEIEDFIYDNERVKNTWLKLASEWKISIINYFRLIFEQEIDIIDLPSDEISRAVVIFERINKGGTRLDNFDLIVAKAARDRNKESLNKRIIQLLEQEIKISGALLSEVKGEKPSVFISVNMDTISDNEITSIIKKQYLNMLSVFSYTDYGNVDEVKIDYTKKEKILNLSHVQINDNTKKAVTALKRACCFLQFRCGLVKISELNYNLMILPIAYLLINDEVWQNKGKLAKLEYWYWASIFAGEYRYNPNERSIRDLQNLYKWIVDGEDKKYEKLVDNVLSVNEFSDKKILLREDVKEEIPSVIHKTILQYILSNQPRDLKYNIDLSCWDIAQGKEKKVEGKKIKCKVEDHHIISLRTAVRLGETTRKIREDKDHILNSPLNRTLILEQTNLDFSDFNPIKYLKQVIEERDTETHLLDHYIGTEYYNDYKGIIDNIEDNEEEVSRKYRDILEKRYVKLREGIMRELNDLLRTR